MLVITRKPDERIIIGEGENEIIISLNEILGNKAKIGIIAPRHIRVYREELLDRERDGNRPGESRNSR